MKEFMKKHKKLVILLIVLLVLAAIVIYFVVQVKKASEMLNEMANAGEVVAIENRALVESLSATGTVVSLDSYDVTSTAVNADVSEVKVSIGDVVKEGDVLCLLDSSDIEENIEMVRTTLEASTKNSNSNVAIAQRQLGEAKVNRNVQVERDYEDAASYYKDYEDALADVDKAQVEYDTVLEKYNWLADTYNSFCEEHPDVSQYLYDSKTSEFYNEYSFHLQNYESAKNEKESKENALESAKKSADAALDKYNNLIRSYEDQLRNNDSNIMSRNDSLNSANVSSTTATMNDEQKLKDLEEQLADCTVVAPKSGVVTAVNVTEGGKYSGNALFTIEDDSAYRVSAQIDEYDISKIKVGQRVVIKTNGTGDLELDGKVSEIAPRATKAANGTVASNVTYAVKIDITTPCDDLKMDMTAKLSIILAEKDNVLTVPYDAVQVDEDGAFYVEKADNTRISVTKGLESDYYIEVFGDGIEEGVEIIVPKPNAMNDFLTMLQEQGAMGGM